VNGYSQGPPPSACTTMRPGAPHGENDAKRGFPPFELEAEVQRNDQVKVFLRNNRQERKFKGFMIMAKANGMRGHGYFYPSKESESLAAAFDCENFPQDCVEQECQGRANALTHNSNVNKTVINAIWTPPSFMSGEIVFVATVVGENNDEASTWWENIESSPIFL